MAKTSTLLDARHQGHLYALHSVTVQKASLLKALRYHSLSLKSNLVIKEGDTVKII